MEINEENDKSERKVTVRVDLKGNMVDTISRAAKLLYNREREDEIGVMMCSEREGDKVVSTMTFRKKDK